MLSLELLDEEITSNPIAYPPAEVLEKATVYELLPDELNKAMDDGWKSLLADDENFTFWLVPALLLLSVVSSITIVVRKAIRKKRDRDYY